MGRRITSLMALTAVGLVLAMVGSVAVAGSAKFHSTSSSVENSGALTVSWDQRGLGEGDINYTLTADASAEYWCINNGGKNPSAANKRTVEGQVSTGGTFQAKNGRVQASLTTGPVSPGDFSCPSGQRLRLVGVSYSNIVLTDTTNGVSTSAPNVSRSF